MKLNEIANDEFKIAEDWLNEHEIITTLSKSNNRIILGSSIYAANRSIDKVPFKAYKVSVRWDVSHNNIRNLQDCGIPDIAPFVNISDNPISSLVGICDIIKSMEYNGSFGEKGIFEAINCPIQKGGIGLMLIPGLRKIAIFGTSALAFDIIQSYIGKPDKIFECQQELIENNLEAYAEL